MLSRSARGLARSLIVIRLVLPSQHVGLDPLFAKTLRALICKRLRSRPKLYLSFRQAFSRGLCEAWNLMSVDLPQQGLRKCAFLDMFGSLQWQILAVHWNAERPCF